ncbi:MAG: hypothetical protein H7222_03770 [Methylotenera sp.]|nr:hypothetical protein [Oligoflexia bacterium]
MFKFLIPLFLLTSVMVMASEVPADAVVERLDFSSKKTCRFSDVKAWSSLGTRWAEGFDASGSLLAIYDLSYPSLLDRVVLGRIGGKAVQPAALAQMIEESRADVLENEQEKQETDQLLSALSDKTTALDLDTLPSGWWQTLPWTTPAFGFANEAPASFTLDDIDLESVVKDTHQYRKDMKKAEAKISAIEEEDFKVKELLKNLKFARNPDGSYEMTFEGMNFASRPRKIAGIACMKDGQRTGLAWQALHQVFESAINSVLSPTVAGIFATAMNRFNHYQDLKRHSHEEMLMEALIAAENGEIGSPVAHLSADDRLTAAASVLLTEGQGVGLLKWIFKRPKKEWKRLLKAEVTYAAHSSQWMAEHQRTFTELNPRFALETTAQKSEALLMLSRRNSLRRGPWIAVDYSKPEAIRRSRLIKEIEIVAVDFASRFIVPYGTVLRAVNKRIIEKPMTDAKIWEARLSSHLENSSVIPADFNRWESELKTLSEQRVNPLELSRSASVKLVSDRKAALNIP